jgi:hypothetical protein
MSKKKNTLKDLDEFLKQQAATLVAPTKLNEKATSDPEHDQETSVSAVSTSVEISPGKILHDLQLLAKNDKNAFRKDFYDLIIQSIESQDQSLPEDKMLINTALYLKSGQRWKEAIRDYWKAKGH